MAASLIDGLHFKAALPLAWRAQSVSACFESARYLVVLADFETRADEHHREQAELHAKLDLALLWLARSLCPQLPAVHESWIGLDIIVWLADSPMQVGEGGVLQLSLSEAMPFLLQLPARIRECIPVGQKWQIHADLQINDENLRDSWERTVFRRHRRAIQLERGETK